MRLRIIFPLAALSTLSLFAQGLASLTGTVSDLSGAWIAGANVTAQNVSTGVSTSGVTAATGNFTFTNLAVGEYQVTVEKADFRTHRYEKLMLLGAQPVRLEVLMQIGSSSESVTVTADASMMKTDSGTLVYNITPQNLQSLPLMSVYGLGGLAAARDPFAVLQTLPGVVFFGQGITRIDGLAETQLQYRLEGEVLGQYGAQTISTRTQPSADAIQEITVQSANYSAEFGSIGGALLSVTMKSGSNQYHGTLYDYMSNESFNAGNPGISISSGLLRKNRIRRHDYGFNIGGPVNLPGIYSGLNRSFFFFNWEQLRDTQLVRLFTAPTVPTPAYREGDFSGLFAATGGLNLMVGLGQPCPPNVFTGCQRDYKDPNGNTVRSGQLFDPGSYTTIQCNALLSPDCGTNGSPVAFRTPLLNNKLTPAMMDPVALAIQNQYVPLPNLTGSGLINNYYNPYNSARLVSMPSFKVDHNLSSTARLSFTYQLTKTAAAIQAANEGFPATISANTGLFEMSPNYRLNFDQSLTPTLQLHLGAGWSQFEFNNAARETNFDPADIGLKGITFRRNFPRVQSSIVNTANLGGLSPLGPLVQTVNPERRPSGTVHLTWIKNGHTLKFGSEWRFDMLPAMTYTNTAGTINTTPGATWTGNDTITSLPSLQLVSATSGNSVAGFGYANFLLGSVRSLTLAQPIAYRNSKHQWGAFLQDTWRAARNLTVDIGLRWDYGTYAREDRGRNSNLSLAEPNPSAFGRAGAAIYEATCQCRFAQNYPYAIGPRLGIAYTLNPKTVIRGGLGVSYGSTGVFGGFVSNSATTPTPTYGLDVFKLKDGYPRSVNPQWPVFDANFGHNIGAISGSPPVLLDPNAGRPPRTLQWNVSLQRELTRNLNVEVSYVGNRGVWQTLVTPNVMVSHNAVSEQLLAHYGFQVGNVNDGNLLSRNIGLLNATERSLLASRGVVLPYPNFPTATGTVFQSIRPFPQYNSPLTPNQAPLGGSWYDSLQVSLNKRYSHGLLVSANYTLSKNLIAGNLPDVFNPNYGNKDLVPQNPPQSLRVSFEYQVPRPSSSVPLLGNRYVSHAIGGWGVSMSLFYASAPYINRPSNGTVASIARWLGRGPGSAQLRKDSQGNFMSPWSVDWTDYDGNRHTEPIDINCHCFDPEKTLVLNPAAWEYVPDGKWAEQTQIIPSYRGVRRPMESGNLARNFRFGKDGRVTLQIRVEFQNLFNRLLLPVSPQGAGMDPAAKPTVVDGRYTGGFGTFGNLRAANAFGQSRTGLLIGRLSF